MSEQDSWRDGISELDERDRSLLLGGTLSRRFSGLPLWLSHPANIGGFYGDASGSMAPGSGTALARLSHNSVSSNHVQPNLAL